MKKDVRAIVSGIRSLLPTGDPLTHDIWASRQTWVVRLLWVHVLGIAVLTLERGHGPALAVILAGILACLALLAAKPSFSRPSRALIASAGLIGSSCMLVHVSGGYIESHFHFFVILAVIALYQQWAPFLLSLGVVVLHHGIMGTIAPHSVYNHPAAWASPWRWAMIHALFVMAECVAIMAYWRANELATSAMLASEARMRLILDSALDAIVGIDATGTIINWDGRSEAIFGWTRAEAVGLKLTDTIIPPKYRDQHARGLRHYLTVGNGPILNRRIEISGLRKDGTEFPVELTVSPVKVGDSYQFSAFVTDITDRKQAECSLKKSESKYRELVGSLDAIVWEADPASLQVTYISPQVHRLLGYTPEQWITGQVGWRDVIHPDDFDSVVTSCAAYVAKREDHDLEYRMRAADGHDIWVRDLVTVVLEADTPVKLRGILVDITQRKATEFSTKNYARQQAANADLGQLALMDRDLSSFMEKASDLVRQTLDVEYCAILKFLPNDAGLLMRAGTGWKSGLIGTVFPEAGQNSDISLALSLDKPVIIEDLHTETRFHPCQYLLDHDVVSGATIMIKTHGLPWGILKTCTTRKRTFIQDDVHYLQAAANVMAMSIEQTELETQLRQLAQHDALTGLPNRVLFNDRLERAIAQANRRHEMTAVIFVDLDNFKVVNDGLGHATGDLLLKQVAACLSETVRDSDTVARLGGDEFAIVLGEVHGTSDAEQVAHKILETFSRIFVVGDREIVVTPSMGISMYPADGMDAGTLLQNADAALYESKGEGRNTYRFSSPTLRKHSDTRVALETDLRKGLDRQEFQVHYQPQVDLSTGRVAGMEALVRWMHPSRGLVSPAQFLPLAEETGLIVPLGTWVLQTACRQTQTWTLEGHGANRIAVNLSVRQFHDPSLVQQVATVLESSGLAPSQLELEITESLAMHNTEKVKATLQELVELGVKLSMDDFGTGYSSLSYLKRLPLSVLKIDQSFVRGIGADTRDEAIVEMVIAIARSLGLVTVAEGVETQVQLDFLRDHGCGRFQGYLFSKPVPAMEFQRLLQEGKCLSPAREEHRDHRAMAGAEQHTGAASS